MSNYRGFAGLSKDQRTEMARKGGIASHKLKAAWEWNPDEAREAGRKGAIEGWKRKRARAQKIEGAA